ncbi:NADH dehydrogenase subunit 5 (mitochondrion) [Aplysia californica]|uniref:NADH-ubiquinone oxidoreductase chain 5 n=1 Tax=Aplysia californica TaxID=6500 RepID=Q6Q0B7_APLCA|nr:NADH dehydrogenase subunit 5 [Aplysia californica]AAS67859.1 NADH dehydrogenase subunit 5 [Aplysia californica]
MLLFFTSLMMACGWGFMLMGGQTMILELELMSVSSTNFSIMLIVDKINLSFSMVVTLIAGSVFTFAHKYMEEDHNSDRFLWILMAFVISMNLLTFSGSIFFLLLGWDGLGITSFALIIYYQSFESLSAGFQTLMVNRLGDALISCVYSSSFVLVGQFSFISLSDNFISVGLVLMLSVAALTKSAQYPFSSWLPAAMAAPTPVSALVHSSTLVTAGIYLIIRLSYNVPLSEEVKSMLLFTGAITCLLGGWAATYENDIKKIIALSTLSQLGVMVFSLGLGFPGLALFHLYTHALFKALLFLAAGNMLMATYGSQDIRLMGGIGMAMPFTIIMFNVSSLCLVGAPFLSAFYSKHVILGKMVMSSLNLSSMVIMFVATMMTAKYVSRSLKAISWNKPTSSIMAVSSNFYTSFPVTILGIGGIVSGKFLSMIDLGNLELAYIPSLWGNIINIITLGGITLGLIRGAQVLSNHYLSSMFFLPPSLVSSKASAFSSKEMSSLDYGWLEPSFSAKNYHSKFGSVLSDIGVWPQKQSFFMAGLILAFTLVFVTSSYF